MQRVDQLLLNLTNPNLRGNALHELAILREEEQPKDFGLLLWNSFGTIAIILQEVISIYPILSSPNLDLTQSNRARDAIALLHYVAFHETSRMLFLKAAMHQYLYPVLDTTIQSEPYDNLRLISLKLFDKLVRDSNEEVVNDLSTSLLFPPLFRSMEFGNDLCKTVATSIIGNILASRTGLEYIRNDANGLFGLVNKFEKIISTMPDDPSSGRLLGNILGCYGRLNFNRRSHKANALVTALQCPDIRPSPRRSK